MPSRSVLTNVGHAVRSARTNPLPRSSTIASDRSTLSIGTLRGRSGRCLARACWGYRYFVPTGHLAPPPALASQLWGAPYVPYVLPQCMHSLLYSHPAGEPLELEPTDWDASLGIDLDGTM